MASMYNQTMNEINAANIKLQHDYYLLGKALTEAKATKAHKVAKYRSFKRFVEDEYNLSMATANRLMKLLAYYNEELGVSNQEMTDIGYDRLALIKPALDVIPDMDKKMELVDAAELLAAADLRDQVADIIEKAKKPTAKELLIEQFKERMEQALGCPKGEITYNLALYFTGWDNDAICKMKTNIQAAKRELENAQAGEK